MSSVVNPPGLSNSIVLGDNGNAVSERPAIRFAKTITASDHGHGLADESIFKPDIYAITGTEADNTVLCPGHPYANGAPVKVSKLVGGAGLTASGAGTTGTSYFVVNAVAGVSFQLSLTLGGAAVDFTTDITSGKVNLVKGYSFLDGIFEVGDKTITDPLDRGVLDHVVAGVQGRARVYCNLGKLYNNVSILRVEAGHSQEILHNVVFDVTKVAGATATIQYGLQIQSLTSADFNVSIGSNGTTTQGWHAGGFAFGKGTFPVASAIAEFDSTTRGVLFPRMTTAQKTAIASPAAGLVVYDTTLNKLCLRTASAWETITSV